MSILKTMAFRPVVVTVQVLGEGITRTWPSISAALAALSKAERDRKARISTMHRAYRHKTRNRW